ncbi:MAG TPA: tetratricopeptide repeat protein [Nitrospiria bacterium]|nr:tetratricopeptide repeat protein [Nitrospiria bacterium]
MAQAQKETARCGHAAVSPETAPPPASLWARPWAVFLLLALLGLIVYSNTFSSPFQFDDHPAIVNNPAVKHFSSLLLSGSRVVTYLSFAINYHLGGLQVAGYHAVNLLIHVLNGFLVYALVSGLVSTPRVQPAPFTPAQSHWLAFATALLFVAHPVQTEAVTYLYQRATSLTALFYLLAVVCYLRWRLASPEAKVRHLWYAGSLISTVLAMKTKEISFTLPILLLLMEAVFFGMPRLKQWLALTPFLLTLPIIPLSALPGAMSEGADVFARETGTISRLDYLYTQFHVIVTYVRLLVLPVRQNLDYDFPVSHSLLDPAVLLSFVFLCALFGSACWLLLFPSRTARPAHATLIGFGLLWFFVTLSIESSIIPIRDVMSEHRLYLPSVGFFLVVTTAASGAAIRWPRPAAAGFLVLLVLLVGAAYARNQVWRTELSLWQDVISKSPRKARGYNNLGYSYESLGNLPEAITYYRKALELEPMNYTAHYDLGNTYRALGRLEEAAAEYQSAIAVVPSYADAHENLGVVYESQGDLKKAMQEYLTAIKYKPYSAEAYNSLGLLFKKLDRQEDAVRAYRVAIKLDPEFAEAYRNLGGIYKNTGRVQEALPLYEHAVTLHPDDSDARYELGGLYKTLGRRDEAAREFQAVIRLKPDESGAYINLGLLYFQQGRAQEAVELLEKGLAFNPNNAQIHNVLGFMYGSLGRGEEAVREYQTSIKLQPNYAGTYENLGQLYLKQHQYSEARGVLEQAVLLAPADSLGHYLLGLSLESLGRQDEALHHYQTAVKLKPDFADAQYQLGMVYQRIGQKQLAIQAFERTLQLKPDHDEASKALAALGR